MAITPTPEAILEVREWGLDSPPNAPPVGELPPVGSKWVVPHYQTKVGLINYLSRAYRWTFDEATRDNQNNAVAMLRDLVIRDALAARFVPVVQLAWHLEPRDETNPQEVEATKFLTEVLELTPRWTDFIYELMWAVWYGRAGSMLRYEWDFNRPDGKRCLKIADHRPINGDLIVQRWDQEVGFLVNYEYPGVKEISDGRGWAHFLTPEEAECVIVHRHIAEDADWYEPELAGAIGGVGLRGHAFWFWWLKSNYLALLSNYSERFANGIVLSYFDESNPNGKQDMEQAICNYTTNRIISIPRIRSGETAYGVEVQEVGTATPAFLLDIQREFNSLITGYITGNLLENGTDVSVGGDAVSVVTQKIGRVLKWDATRLAETLSNTLMHTLAKYNTPGVRAPKFVFEVDKPDASEILGYAKAIHELGGDIDLDSLYEIAGLAKPGLGAQVSSKLQPMSPSNVSGVPMGVPTTPPPQNSQNSVNQPLTTPEPQTTMNGSSLPQPSSMVA